MTERSDPSAVGNPGNPALERCLEILKAAKNDSEQFAALLLVTKCAKASGLDDGTRRRIFDAVGFSFPNRLLLSKSSPDGCPEYLLRSLGLTLFACFCTDPSLTNHPQILNKIPILNETISAPSQQENKNESSMVEDAYQCLVGIMASPRGIKHLVSGGTISSLCQAYLNHSPGWESALKILTTLLTSMPDESWKESQTALQLLLVKISEEFTKEEDSRKFHLLEILPVFLPPSQVWRDTSWRKDCLKHICGGLFKVIRNKLSVSQRDLALKLGGCLSLLDESNWIVTKGKEKGQFFCLLVNLACIEIRMALEDPNPLRSRQAVVTACYALVEMGIEDCRSNDRPSMLKVDQNLQLLQVIQEACGAVMYYLQQFGWEEIEDPFVLASVRLLGAWLEVEAHCLKQEVIQLLPFLIHYVRTMFQRSATCRAQPKEVSRLALLSWGATLPGNAIRFVFPAICHLSAKAAPRLIMISEGLPGLLCDYYIQQWEVFSSKDDLASETRSEAELSLQTCCEILFNLVVTEPTLVGQESCFVTFFEFLVHSLPALFEDEWHMTLMAQNVTLGLRISQFLTKTPALQEDASRDFFKASIQFLSHCFVASINPDTGEHHMVLQEAYLDSWAHISALWFLGVHAFSACIPLLPWLSPLVLESGWLHSLLSLLGQVSPQSVDTEVVTVLQVLFTELAQSNVSCRELIQQQGGLEKANIYGMAALQQYLSDLL